MRDIVRFTIKNLNREKILKEVVKIADIRDIECNQEHLIFSVNKKHGEKVKKILENKYINIQKEKQKGFFNFLKTTILRVGVIVPLFIYIVFLIFANNFVFMFEIKGLNRIEKQEIIEILNKNNLSGIVLKNKINTKKLELDLQKINGVGLVSTIIKGNTLVISIKEKTYNVEFEDKDEFGYLLSEYDATITAITMIQGTSLVKPGQTVKKGQKLVAPYVIDPYGNKLAVNPLAEIRADVYYSTTESVLSKQILLNKTGNHISSRQIYLNNVLIFSENIDCPFKLYEIEKQEKYLTKNNCLPLKVVYIKYNEQQEVVIDDYFNKNKEQILTAIQEKTRQQVQEYDIIKDEYNTIVENAGVFFISHTVVVNKII